MDLEHSTSKQRKRLREPDLEASEEVGLDNRQEVLKEEEAKGK
jgi:hypothetical protein